MHSPAATSAWFQLTLVCVLAGSSLAVFYTKGKDTDYPRIGRRSFYTSGSGNHYPRIGRRAMEASAGGVIPSSLLLLSGSRGGAAGATSSSSLPPSPSGSGGSSSSSSGISPAAAEALSQLAKRGVFTSVKGGYQPRTGRSNGNSSPSDAAISRDRLNVLNSRRDEILQRLAELREEEMEAEEDGEDGDTGLHRKGEDDMQSETNAPIFSLEIMFLAFDTDGDGSLSKEEFATGMRKYRQQNPLC